jgi:polyhydroxyalkanoate synthesis regulator phasin
MLVNEIRRYMEAAMGKLSPKRAQELARSLTQGQGKEQISKVAQDLMDWSNKNRERLLELVRTEVRSQLKQVGVASRDEVDSLRRRVRELEKEQGGRKKATAKPAATKRAAAKKTTAKRTVAKATPPSDTPAVADAPASA